MAWSRISVSSTESEFSPSLEENVSFADSPEERILPPDQVAFDLGKIIVTCRPYIHTVTTKYKEKFCDRCLLSVTEAKRLYKSDDCKCGQISYCKSCLKSLAPSIFKMIHKLECPLLTKYSNILSDSTKLFLRLCLRLENSQLLHYQVNLDPLTGHPITFDSLIPNLDGIMENSDDLAEQILKCHQIYLSGNDDLDPKTPLDDLDRAILLFIAMLDELRPCEELLYMIEDDDSIYKLWTIFIRLWSHTIPIYDETVTGLFSREVIAYGLYLEPSAIVKHSCIPNCAFAHYGSVLQLRAMATIAIDEPLTVSFADLSLPKNERQKELKSYYLNCRCKRCMQVVDPIDYERFRSTREEFVATYNQELVSSYSKSRSILNFSTSFNYGEEDVREMCNKCAHLLSLGYQLSQYYGLIYENQHPDITRFMFAYTAIKTNLLLLRLALRDTTEDTVSEDSEPNHDKRESTGTVTSMDRYVKAIENWSRWLKSTVQLMRCTHGLDHKLFRVMPVPLMEVWHQANSGRQLTMAQLYPDTGILLQILSASPLIRRNVLEWLQIQFSQLIAGGQTEESGDKQNRDHYSMTGAKIFCTFLFLIIALLFPLFIHFVFYVQDYYH